MRHWLLDDGPLGVLAQSFNPAWSWPAGQLHVAESVAAAAPQDRSGRRTKLLTMGSAEEPCFIAHPIFADTEVAQMVYGHLRPEEAQAKRDLGEDEAIALCALELTEVMFVTMDKGASYQALVELGPGRVSSPFDLWLELRDEALITPAEFEKLCDKTASGDSGIVGVPKRLRG